MGMILAAVLVGGVLAGFTDWLLMGVLFHDAYNTYPEVWWPSIRDGETSGAVIWSVVLGFVMTAAVVILCAFAGADTPAAGLKIGALAFLAGPLPVVLINSQFVKTDVWMIVSQALGYLARLLIAGAVAGLLLP